METEVIQTIVGMFFTDARIIATARARKAVLEMAAFPWYKLN